MSGSVKPEIWIGLVWLKGLRDFHTIIEEAAGAYSNILTWADSPEEYRRKVEILAASYDLYVVEVENAEPVSVKFSGAVVDPVIQDLINQAEDNPKAILFSTLHKYPHENG